MKSNQLIGGVPSLRRVFVGILLVCSANSLSAQTVWNSAAQFSSVQGQDGWYYRTYREATNTFVDDLWWSEGRWIGSTQPGGFPRQLVRQLHPGTGSSAESLRQIVRSWEAPVTGRFVVSGFFSDGNSTVSGNGVDGRIWIDSNFASPLYVNTWSQNEVGYRADFDLGELQLNAGQQIHIAVLNRVDGTVDHTNIELNIVLNPCDPGLANLPILFAANQATDSVMALDGVTGAVIREFAGAASGLDYANGMAYDEGAGLFVSSVETDSVIQFDIDTGQVVQQYAGGGLDGPDGIILTQDDVIVTSFVTDSVKGFSRATGQYTRDYVSPNRNGLDGPSSMVRAADGSILISSEKTDQVLRFDLSNGNPLPFAASGAPLDQPAGLLFMPDGDLLVASLGSDEVLRYDPNGVFVSTFVTAGSGGLDGPRGLGWNASGNLVVASLFNDQLLEYDGDTGAFIAMFATAPEIDDPSHLLGVFVCREDCNADGVIDQWSLDTGQIADRNRNGVPDNCELLVVDSLGDANDPNDGALTLREAIVIANQTGDVAIEFDPNLAGGVIQPLTPLPPIQSAHVSLNGDVDTDGMADLTLDGSLAGTSDGVRLFGATTSVHGLAIVGFSGNGILSSSVFATDHLIEHCLIGVRPNGAPLPNGVGIRLNEPGTLHTIQNNVISGNLGAGLLLEEVDLSRVEGNLIGTDPTGTAAVANGGDGVVLTMGSSGNQIGTAASGNTIAGNLGNGISIRFIGFVADDNKILNNKIGVDSSGLAAIPNHGFGVKVSTATNTQIGDGGAGNVISGNLAGGVLVEAGSSLTAIVSNFFGLNEAGSAAIASGGHGVSIIGGSNTNVVGPGNVISGHAQYGVFVESSDNAVRSNYCGTTADGASAVPNQGGVLIKNSINNNVVDNVISGNTSHGVELQSANDTFIRENMIGTDPNGILPLPNGQIGIRVETSSGSRIGGAAVGNVVAANGQSGIATIGACSGVRVEGNWIGIGLDSSDLPNGLHGVELGEGCVDAEIGARSAGLSNQIHSFGASAVVIRGQTSVRNSVLENAISSDYPAIELQLCGNGGFIETTIDAVSASGVSGGTAASDGSTVDVYVGATGSPEAYLGSTAVLGGSYTFSAAIPAGVVCVSVTEIDGSTSQFTCDELVAAPVVQPSRGDLVISDPGSDALLLIDSDTGDRTVLSSATVGVGQLPLGPAGIAVRFPRQIAVGDDSVAGLYNVSTLSGDRTQVAGCSNGSPLAPLGVVVAGQATIVVDRLTQSLVSIDDATGQRTTVSGSGVGTGPDFNEPSFLTPLDANRLAVTTSDSVLAVDLATGNRTLLSGPTLGTGPVLADATGIAVADPNSLLVLVGGATPSLLQIDVGTGNRTTLVAGLVDPLGIRPSVNDGQFYFIDRGQGTVYRFDASDDSTSVVSSSVVGSGPPLTEAIDVLVWPFPAGDTNGDGVVDLSDLAAVLAGFGTCDGDASFAAEADVNGDGCVDLADLAVVLGTFGAG